MNSALYDAGYTRNTVNPDDVVVGEARSDNLPPLEKAVLLVPGGAPLIGANPDRSGPTEHGTVPATGMVAGVKTEIETVEVLSGVTPADRFGPQSNNILTWPW